MAKFEEAEERLFRNVFVCKKCKTKVRAPAMLIAQNKVKCRKCNSKALRAIKKK